jgi:WD40 repeat protein
MLLSAAANRAAPTEEARRVLQRALMAQPQLRAFLPRHDTKVWSIAISPDGRTLATGDTDGTLHLWDLEAGRPLGEPLTSHKELLSSLSFSPDGKMLASSSDDDTVILWDVASRKPLSEPIAAGGRKTAFAPDGATLAFAGGNGKLVLWDVATRQPRNHPLQGGNNALAFSPDGKTMAADAGDGTVTLLDLKSGTQRPLGAPTDQMAESNSIWSVAFSPDSQTLAVATGGTFALWSVAQGQLLGEPITPEQGVVYDLTYSPDGKLLASSGSDGSVMLWGVEYSIRSEPRSTLRAHQERANAASFSPDGRTLVSVGDDGAVIVWDVAVRDGLGERLDAGQEFVGDVAFSPDGTVLAAAGTTLVLWDAATRRPLVPALPVSSVSVAFSADGRLLAAMGDSVQILDAATGKPLGEPLPASATRSVAVSADGKTLAAGGETKASLWDVATRRLVGEVPTGAPVFAVAFSPDGRTLAVSDGGQTAESDASVILWSVTDGEPIGEPLQTNWFGVYGLAFSPDGRMLAVAGDGLALWDTASRRLLGEALQTESSQGIAFGAGGGTLASTFGDKHAMLWDMAVRKPIGELFVSAGDYSERLTSLAMAHGDKLLAAGRADGKVILWSIDLDTWLQKACDIAGRNLTRREWAQYVGEGVPYQPACPQLPAP